MLRKLTAALLLRRMSRDLREIASALAVQNGLLARIADHIAPATALPSRESVQQDTGLSFLDDHEAAAALAYIERTAKDTGHLPDEEEVLVYLADEKTQSLQQRLIERDEQLQRLAQERRW